MTKATPLLEVRDLCVAVGDKPVLNSISLKVAPGELHVLLGPNGSGKSSLLAAIMGLPPWRITSGTILLDGTPIDEMSLFERAQLGIGMAFQRPPSLEGVSLNSFAKSIDAHSDLDQAAERLNLTAFLQRDLNVGFSGGEIKRWEVLKLILQDPHLALFDEPESGVDLEHVKAIGTAIQQFMARPDKTGRQRAGLVITHTGLILAHVDASHAHILQSGELVHSGPPTELFQHVQSHGYSVPLAS